MKHAVHIALGAFTSIAALTAASPIGRQTLVAQTNWREVRSLKMGRFYSRIDVSPARMVRLYSQLDTSRLTSPELPADSVRAWQQFLLSELDRPPRRLYMLGNAIPVPPPGAAGRSVG